MRRTPNIRTELYRRVHPVLGTSSPGENWGYFEVQCPDGFALRIIASDGTKTNESGWEHVSVSREDRIPTWLEMQQVKEMFWEDEETVIQFHPRKSEYVNRHPYVLHLWRKRGPEVELPPKELIG